MNGSREAASVPTRLGDFEIHEVLGQGGSGVVYAAKWGHREVALKVLREELVGTERERTRFFEEAKILADLGHPGVVKVLSVGEIPDGRPYLAMERLRGEPLGARLERGRVEIGEALALFDQITSAADAMHARGLVHRDLKPDNVFLVEGGRYAVLLDFGIAKELDAPASTTTQEGGVRGTPAYMAPERFFGQPARTSTDVYELAVLLYAMLVGRLPWDVSADPDQRLNPQRPSQLGVTLPGQLEPTLLKAMSTRPEARPSSAAELGRAVRAAAGIASPETTPRRTVDLPPRSGPAPAQTGDVQAPTEGPRPAVGQKKLLIALSLVLIGAASGATLAVWLATRDSAGGESGEQVGVERAGGAPASGASADAAPPREGDDSVLFTAAEHHPDDTRLLVGVRVREARQSEALSDLIDAASNHPQAAPIRALGSMCGVDPIEEVDWVTVGLAGESRDEIDVILSGAWSRGEIERCVASFTSDFSGAEPVRDGDLTELRGDGSSEVVGWLDDRAFIYSSRGDRAWMRARLAGEASAAGGGRLESALEDLDTRATLWLAAEPDPAMAEELLGEMEAPRLLAAAVDIAADIRFSASLHYRSRRQAERAGEQLRERPGGGFGEPGLEMVFRELAVETRGSVVEMRAHLDPAMTSLVVGGLHSALGEAR